MFEKTNHKKIEVLSKSSLKIIFLHFYIITNFTEQMPTNERDKNVVKNG